MEKTKKNDLKCNYLPVALLLKAQVTEVDSRQLSLKP